MAFDQVSSIETFAETRPAAHPSALSAVRPDIGTRQRTLATAVRCSGVGLHSGKPATIVLRPAAAGTGIVFRRTDIADGKPEGKKDPMIAAAWNAVVATNLCTVLGNADGVTVSTVEHLMAALAGCEIDNALVEVDGPEVPIMDGSAAPFVFLVECAGTAEQSAPRMALRIVETVRVAEGDKEAVLAPAAPGAEDGFTIDLAIEFGSAAIGRQHMATVARNGRFKADISRARTFGFLTEVETLRKMGLAQGGSLDNAIVVDGDKVLNEGGLRYDDEFVRHKVLDAIGDMALAGWPVIGRYSAVKPSHALNNKLLRALFATPSAWRREPA